MSYAQKKEIRRGSSKARIDQIESWRIQYLDDMPMTGCRPKWQLRMAQNLNFKARERGCPPVAINLSIGLRQSVRPRGPACVLGLRRL